MPSKSQLAGLLADRLDRLRLAFAALHRSVRDRVAEIVGTTVADVARQAVRAALDPPGPAAPAPRRVVRGDLDDRYDAWGGADPDGWADDPEAFEHGEPTGWGRREPVSPTPTPMPTPPVEPAVMPRILSAAVVGLKAAAWWLATSRLRRGWCVLAGVAAGGAAYALGGLLGLAVAPAVTALILAARSVEVANTLSA